jgi:hypothetical protein
MKIVPVKTWKFFFKTDLGVLKISEQLKGTFYFKFIFLLLSKSLKRDFYEIRINAI